MDNGNMSSRKKMFSSCQRGKFLLLLRSSYYKINIFFFLIQKGNTLVFNKAGKLIAKHSSKLPGGNKDSRVG
jgi:hypothetical protein